MIYVVWLLIDNLDFAAGAASGSPVFKATPWIVLGTFLLGLVVALVVRFTNPDRYALIGRVVMEESHERGTTVTEVTDVPRQPTGEADAPSPV